MLKNILAFFALVWCAIWVVVGTVLVICNYAHAEGPQLTAAQKQLALRVARVAAHEGALRKLREVDLVWQTTQNRGKSVKAQLEFLAAHSGRALGLKPCAGDASTNCVWSPLLDRKGTIPAVIAAGPAEDYWRVVTIPAWKRVLARAEELVAGANYDKPCPVEPYTWGSVKLDSAKAALQGLYPIGCTGTLNDGFAFKPTPTIR